MSDTGWQVGRWWRSVLIADGSLWCESSNEAEVRKSAIGAPGPVLIQNYWRRVQEMWVDDGKTPVPDDGPVDPWERHVRRD